MTLSTIQWKLYLIGGAVVLLAIVGTCGYKDIEARGAQKILLHAADSAHAVALDSVKTTATVAATALQLAEAAKSRALAQVAATARLAAKNDSLARSASAERDHDHQVYADSASSRDSLRLALGRTLARSLADSVAVAAERQAFQSAIAGLLGTISADSTEHAADQRYAESLKALAANTASQLALVKQSAPSRLTKIVYGVVGLGVGYLGGRAGIK